MKRLIIQDQSNSKSINVIEMQRKVKVICEDTYTIEIERENNEKETKTYVSVPEEYIFLGNDEDVYFDIKDIISIQRDSDLDKQELTIVSGEDRYLEIVVRGRSPFSNHPHPTTPPSTEEDYETTLHEQISPIQIAK